MQLSKQFLKQCELYKRFAREYPTADFSDKAKEEMYLYESKGIGDLELGLFSGNMNGYFIGKRNLDITVSMWKDDMKNGSANFFIGELYNDYPAWWLDSIFKIKDKDKHCEFVGFEK